MTEDIEAKVLWTNDGDVIVVRFMERDYIDDALRDAYYTWFTDFKRRINKNCELVLMHRSQDISNLDEKTLAGLGLIRKDELVELRNRLSELVVAAKEKADWVMVKRATWDRVKEKIAIL